jgi:hypothetical protein
VSSGRQQISVEVMVERLSAKRIQLQFVDQILDRIRKLFFVIPDKFAQRGFCFRSGRRGKIIRKTQMQAVDLRQLFLRHNRQFWQRSVSIRHSLFQIFGQFSNLLVPAEA